MTFPVPAFGYFEYPAVALRNHLVTRVPDTYTIVTRIPPSGTGQPRPVKLIVIFGVPGGRMISPILSWRRLIIWCYDTSEIEAAQTAEYVRGYAYEAMYTYGTGIREVRFPGEAYKESDPDDPAKPDRFTQTCDILLRAQTGYTPVGLVNPPPAP
jgi:hypothetical protein